MPSPRDIVLLPDAGPLITLSYADTLDLLFKPDWPVALVDMVLHEVTRNATPTQRATQRATTMPSKANLGELAIQETMNNLALAEPPSTGVFLFEDHKVARPSFLLPDNCRKVSTRAFLLFLEQNGWLTSAAAVERHAIQAGRAFSRPRFPSA